MLMWVNKGGILRASVSYLKILKNDQVKKQQMEEKCKILQQQMKKMITKIQVKIPPNFPNR